MSKYLKIKTAAQMYYMMRCLLAVEEVLLYGEELVV